MYMCVYIYIYIHSVAPRPPEDFRTRAPAARPAPGACPVVAAWQREGV